MRSISSPTKLALEEANRAVAQRQFCIGDRNHQTRPPKFLANSATVAYVFRKLLSESGSPTEWVGKSR